ncbi:MAG TPA: Trk system potassium transporter TrkA [Firmicutes bacterium]|nr:Trk system potassium transporter TrkA [Bacillota bacterium]
MKVIIVGIGKVGYTLAEHLSAEGNDVAVIDKSQETVDRAGDNLDVFCVRGSGLSTGALLEAGVREADLIIATTSVDEINMLCCLTAKRLGAKNTVARIRDPEYAKEVSVLKQELGLNMVINPELETANEIGRVLRFPTAINVETFASRKVELVAFRIRKGDRIAGRTLAGVMGEIRLPVLFCTAVRGEQVVIPDGSFVPLEGDLMYIAGMPSAITAFFKYEGQYKKQVKNAVIIGGGRIAYYLGLGMSHMGMKIKIIEQNKKRCEELDELLPDCTIIHGDGTDEMLLEEECVDAAGAVVTLTGRDEENLLTALYASRLKVPKVIAKINRGNYEGIIKEMGIDSIVSPKNVTAAQIIRYVRALRNAIGSNVVTLHKIAGGRAEALEFVVKSGSRNLEIPFRDIRFRKNVLVAAIVRGGRLIIPTGTDCIKVNDSVIVVTSSSNVINDLNDVFEAQAGRNER